MCESPVSIPESKSIGTAPAAFSPFFLPFSAAQKGIVFQDGADQEPDKDKPCDYAQGNQDYGHIHIEDGIIRNFRFRQTFEKITLLGPGGKINSHGTDIDAVIGVSDDCGLIFVFRVIGDDGVQVPEGDCLGQKDKVVSVQGQKGLRTAENIVSAVKQSRIVDIVFCF